MRWVVIFSIQFLLDLSFARRDSWVAGSGMITSSGLITCERENSNMPWLKHCNWACGRASVYMYDMFPTSCVSSLSILQLTDLPRTCTCLQPHFCGEPGGTVGPAIVTAEESKSLVWSVALILFWVQHLALWSSTLHWTVRYTSPAVCWLPGYVGRCWTWFVLTCTGLVIS